MPTPKITDIETLILQSRTLALEDKQKLLKILPTLSEEKLARIKQTLENEKSEIEKISEEKIAAWNSFNSSLSTIAQEIK